MRIIVITIFILAFQLSLYSQEQLGLRLENYAGVSSLALNPAGNVSNPLKWDINLAGGGFFLENNYGFILETNTIELWKNRQGANFVSKKDVEGAPRPNDFLLDFYNDDRKRFVSFSNFIAGPSAVFKIKGIHSFGLFTNARFMLSTQDIPNEFSYYKYDTLAFLDSFEVQPFLGVAVGWSEIGLNYALKAQTTDGFFGVGANLRFLQGYEAVYLEVLAPYQHTKLPDAGFSMLEPSGRFGYASSNVQRESSKLERNGKGIAFDVGIVAAFGVFENKYKLKIGASLLDFGYLKFSKNAHAHRVRSDIESTHIWDDYKDFTEPEELDDLIRQFSFQALGDSLASEQGDHFRVSMPAAFSLQGDYAFTGNVFLNATLIQRFPGGALVPARGNLVALTPRFEHRWFSVSVPLSLYNWQDFRIGLAARLGFLVVGSDHLLSWVGQRDWYGTDAYIALKINPFSDGRRKKYKVRCYDF